MKHLLGGRLYFAPLTSSNPPRRVLDIATGTGTWAIEMSDEFPNAEIYGTDLSPVQPTFVPENVHFYIEDAYVVPSLASPVDFPISSSKTAMPRENRLRGARNCVKPPKQP